MSDRRKLVDYRNPSKTYRPSPGGFWSGIDAAVIDGEPIFTWYDVPRMVRDPRVRFCLKMLRAPFGQLKVQVKAKNQNVALFVDRMFKKLWKQYAGRILSRYFQYGFCPFGVEYKTRHGKCEIDRLRIIEPRDANPLEFKEGDRKNEFAGINWPGGSGFLPHVGWFAGEQEYDTYRDIPRIAGAFVPWLEKRSRGGAVNSRRLFYFRHAVGSDCLFYPVGQTNYGTDSVPNWIPNQQLAIRILENKVNGSSVALPDIRDANGNRQWEFAQIPNQTGGDAIREHTKDLDGEIAEGIGIPNEVLEMADGGGGWSGRKIPALAFYQSCDDVAACLIECLVKYAIKPAVEINFGPQEFQIDNLPLSKTLEEGNPNQKPGQPGQGQQQGQQPTSGQTAGHTGGQHPGLQPYQGPHGGHGWMNPQTGRVSYGMSGFRKAIKAKFSSLDNPPDEKASKQALLLAMLELQIAATDTGDAQAVQPELDVLAHLAKNPEDLRKAIQQRGALLGWSNEGQTQRRVTRWRNSDTGILRYQQSEPGGRAKAQENRVQSEAKARELLVKASRFEATPEDFEELATHLPAVGLEKLRNARLILRASFGGERRRDAMVNALIDHAHRHADAMRNAPKEAPVVEEKPKEEAKPVEEVKPAEVKAEEKPPEPVKPRPETNDEKQWRLHEELKKLEAIKADRLARSKEIKKEKELAPYKMQKIVREAGGIDPTTHEFQKTFSNAKEAMEYGIKRSVFKKGGRSLDALARELENQGHFQTPEDKHASDHLLDLLKEDAASHHHNLTSKFDDAENDYYRELQANADKLDREDPGLLDRLMRGSEEAAHAAAADDEYGHGSEPDEFNPGHGEVDDSFDFGEAKPKAEQFLPHTFQTHGHGEEQFVAAHGIDPNLVDPKPGDESTHTAELRSRPMIDAIRKGIELPPPRLRMKPDGRFEIVDGNARTHAYKTAGKPIPAAVIIGADHKPLRHLPSHEKAVALSSLPAEPIKPVKVLKDVKIIRDRSGRITGATVTERTE